MWQGAPREAWPSHHCAAALCIGATSWPRAPATIDRIVASGASSASAATQRFSAPDPISRRDTSIDGRLLVTARFYEGASRPESMLRGVAFQNWFSSATGAASSYRVARTDMPFFAGTGWKVGDVAADVVGYEWDNRDPLDDGNRYGTIGRATSRSRPSGF